MVDLDHYIPRIIEGDADSFAFWVAGRTWGIWLPAYRESPASSQNGDDMTGTHTHK